MIFIAVILLTVWHPGWVLGTTLWHDTGFHLFSAKKTRGVEKDGDGASGMEYSSADSAPTVAPQTVGPTPRN